MRHYYKIFHYILNFFEYLFLNITRENLYKYYYQCFHLSCSFKQILHYYNSFFMKLFFLVLSCTLTT